MTKQMIFLICLIIVVVVIMVYDERKYIAYSMKSCLSSNNSAGLPTPASIQKQVLILFSQLDLRNFTLVDFGSAEGDFIQLVYPFVTRVIGVELDKQQAEQAKQRFKALPQIEILNLNMIDYQFADVPTVLYMYAPLWRCPKKEALSIYSSVLRNISKLTVPYYVIYVGAMKPVLDETFFREFPLKLIKQFQVRRMLGLRSNQIYVYKSIKSDH